MPLNSAWDVSIERLGEHAQLAGVEPVAGEGVLSARDLDARTREALAAALRESVRRARMDAPPVEQWMAASQSLFMNDDGSQAAREREDSFWSSLTQIVNGCLALVMLGDLSESPFFIELLKHQPAGHLIEMSTDVLRHSVDPSGALDLPELIRRAEEWYQTCQVRPELT